MPARQQRLLVASAALTFVLLMLAAGAGHVELLAYAAPVLVLALPLLSGRFVGEDRIARAAAARRRAARRTAPLYRPPAPATWLVRVLSVPRGGRLIADALAVRPPPAPTA